jgi:hypothetical protein
VFNGIFINTDKPGYKEQLGIGHFVRYNLIYLCAKITNLTLKSVRYNRVFINNRVRYNRVSL